MIVCTIRTVSQTWSAWGMPPSRDEADRPPVPEAHTWHAVTPNAPFDPDLRPTARDGDWYRSTDHASFVFRHLGDAERFVASIA